MMEPRISIVTLGVDDLDRAAAFYEAMGLERHKRFSDGVAFFQMGGMILALWPREEIARDAGVRPGYTRAGREAIDLPEAVSGTGAREFSGVALAYNTRTEAEVEQVLAMAERAGGRVLKRSGRAFWGGLQGYFYDTEGNLWEVAYNPDFPIDAEGSISLPE